MGSIAVDVKTAKFIETAQRISESPVSRYSALRPGIEETFVCNIKAAKKPVSPR